MPILRLEANYSRDPPVISGLVVEAGVLRRASGAAAGPASATRQNGPTLVVYCAIAARSPQGAAASSTVRFRVGLISIGDVALVLDVVGEVDGGHATCADLTLDAVAVGEGGFEAVEDVGHGLENVTSRQ